MGRKKGKLQGKSPRGGVKSNAGIYLDGGGRNH